MVRHHLAAALAGVLAALGLAVAATSGLEQPLAAARGPHFREVSAPEGVRLLGHRRAVLLEVLTPTHVERRVPEALLAFADGPLPPALGRAPAAVVILSPELGAGYRMAARLARAGIQEVAVVRGGVKAWRDLRPHLATERASDGLGGRDGRDGAPQRRGEDSDGRTG